MTSSHLLVVHTLWSGPGDQAEIEILTRQISFSDLEAALRHAYILDMIKSDLSFIKHTLAGRSFVTYSASIRNLEQPAPTRSPTNA